MAGLTKLQAINQMLISVGLRRVSALDTDGNSNAAQAEIDLDIKTEEVMEEGWTENTEDDVTLSPPDVQVAITPVADTFLAGETVTETTSAATGRFHQIDTDMLLTELTGTFTGGETLTGGTSGATATGGALATAPTEGEICLDYNILRADSSGTNAGDDIINRGGKLYSRDDNTATFDEDVVLEQVRLLTWDDITPVNRNLISAKARKKFQRDYRGNRLQDAFISEDVAETQQKADKAATENEDVNIFDTTFMKDLLGSGTIKYR